MTSPFMTAKLWQPATKDKISLQTMPFVGPAVGNKQVKPIQKESTANVTSQRKKKYSGSNSTMDFSGLVKGKDATFTFEDQTSFTNDDKVDTELRRTNPVWQEMMRNAYVWATEEARKKSGSASDEQKNFDAAFATALSNVPISEASAWVSVRMSLDSVGAICSDPEARGIYDPRITSASKSLDLGMSKDDTTGTKKQTAPQDVTDNGKLPEAYEETFSACADKKKSRFAHFFQNNFEKKQLNPMIKAQNLAKRDESRTLQDLIQISLKIRPTTILRKTHFLPEFDSWFKSHIGGFLAKNALNLQLTHAAMDVGGLMTDFGSQYEYDSQSDWQVGVYAGDSEAAKDGEKNSQNYSESAKKKKTQQLRKAKQKGQYLYQYRKFNRIGNNYLPWVVEVIGEVNLTQNVRISKPIRRHVSVFGRQMIRDFLTLKENQNEYGVYRNPFSLQESESQNLEDAAAKDDGKNKDGKNKDVKNKDEKSNGAWKLVTNNCQHYADALGSFLLGAKRDPVKVTLLGRLVEKFLG